MSSHRLIADLGPWKLWRSKLQKILIFDFKTNVIYINCYIDYNAVLQILNAEGHLAYYSSYDYDATYFNFFI